MLACGRVGVRAWLYACLRACVRACVRASVRVCVRAWARARAGGQPRKGGRACLLAYIRYVCTCVLPSCVLRLCVRARRYVCIHTRALLHARNHQAPKYARLHERRLPLTTHASTDARTRARSTFADRYARSRTICRLTIKVFINWRAVPPLLLLTAAMLNFFFFELMTRW